MDNQDFDRWMEQALEQYQFSEVSVLPQMEAVFDKVESLKENLNWWQKYWKGGMFGGIVIGGLIALLTFYQQDPIKPQANGTTNTLSIPFASPATQAILAEAIGSEPIPQKPSSLVVSLEPHFDLEALSDRAFAERLSPMIEAPKVTQMLVPTISWRKLAPLNSVPIPNTLELAIPEFKASYSRVWSLKIRSGSGASSPRRQGRFRSSKSDNSFNRPNKFKGARGGLPARRSRGRKR